MYLQGAALFRERPCAFITVIGKLWHNVRLSVLGNAKL
ncbi:hypothetical protein U370_03105 [Anaplasma marginale str. Dawn]|nr:hypothetical protein U128_03220 [Anaplasma marginale str. Gypsy Plains]AGZ80125.1 hypothetical protein U370_03105 [Anaplasma marginale str. Dawn]